MALIKAQALVEDPFVPIAEGQPIPAAGDVLLELSRYEAAASELAGRNGRVGVILPPDVSSDVLPGLVQQVQLLAIQFKAYTDGRGYSLARRLRTQHGFKGELRAVGEVLRDQLLYMQRCGFDAFELKAGKDVEGALAAFREFSVSYQGSAQDPRPLYRRRTV